MAGGSRKVVLLALGANFGIGCAKLVAYAFTGSGSMLAESIHSFADSGNQGLLLLGGSRAAKEPNDQHPLGYGREAYFWALMVAVILFTMGGGFSLYEGIHKLQHPAPLENPWWAIGVLVFAMLLEGGSLWAAWKMCKAIRGDDPVMEWAGETGNVDLLVVLFEDIAAQGGLLCALIAVIATWVTGNPLWDALGTCVIGVLLLCIAVFVGYQVRRLIVGCSVERGIRDGITEVWDEHGFEVLRLIAVWSGPERIMIALKVRDRDQDIPAEELIGALNKAEKAARERFPRIGFQFVEPDVEA